MQDYDRYDALGLADLVARGEVKPEELLDEAIRRTEAVDPKINAVVIRLFERARDTIAAGLPEGPFRGVPFLVKDLFVAIEGVRTTNGSKLFEDYVTPHSNELMKRYERAGLVVFGKTHSPEFGLTTSTESAVFGATRNPWNLDHTSGGSSGGASAAVAAGILPLANASDGGGSIRIPAACCGLLGMKPTRGRTPMGPDAGEGWAGMSTVHAVSRSVRDNAALLDASAGPDVGDPYWAPPPARPWADEVGQDPGRLRIAFQRETWNGQPTHPDCIAAVEDAAKLCEDLGHDVVDRRLEVDAEAIREAALTIIAGNLRFTLDDRARSLGRELEQGMVENGTFFLAQAALGKTSADYARSVRVIHGVTRQVARHLIDADVILTPTMGGPPEKIGTLSLSNPDIGNQIEALNRSVGFTQLFNVSGNPAISVPLCWNEAGLPIGIQFAGRFGDEATLYRLAAQLEQARPWFDRRPAGF